jgi:hypothetical protein
VGFHVHGDYVKQQAQHFSVRNRVANSQPLGTIPKRKSDCFSNFSHKLARGYEIRERQQPKVRPLNFD